ncbi:sirohydrochlorin chelatase [Tabrizicola oligotrophica]|uniref:Cobalamin biosynthesis protein CbiX n=1 Tax=Tabrizicola oligotrophica TaxID=2710650 RepID=A0A6M0QSM8_9RHOB|nr:cobalamin biosynthesis protein CbiX [Tabrizicola oligotrophica]NEY90455.1 cobalamin biosynthesis protein CbiX [Tabrizicola oligotrophica]
MEPVLIVAHGQPSDPAPAEAALAGLAGQVGALLPGRAVGSATLAAPGALAAAVARLGPGLVVFPLFMAGGWFTRVHLPGELARAGAVGWRMLEPFGCLEAVQALAVDLVVETGATAAILAAHGSFKSRVPAAIAGRVAAMVAARGLRVACGFIDQAPQLAGITGFGPGSVCLPFFAAGGDHVTEDIPAALAKAGFQGRLLPALGLDARVPGLIAEAVREGRGVCAGGCRWG